MTPMWVGAWISRTVAKNVLKEEGEKREREVRR